LASSTRPASQDCCGSQPSAYGAREIGIKDPAGHYVTFAQFNPQPQN